MHFIDMPWIRKSIVPVVRSNADHACVWKISLFSSTPTFHSSASHLLSTFHGNRAMTFSLPFKWEYKNAAHLWDVSLCLFVWFLFCCGLSLFPQIYGTQTAFTPDVHRREDTDRIHHYHWPFVCHVWSPHLDFFFKHSILRFYFIER